MVWTFDQCIVLDLHAAVPRLGMFSCTYDVKFGEDRNCSSSSSWISQSFIRSQSNSIEPALILKQALVSTMSLSMNKEHSQSVDGTDESQKYGAFQNEIYRGEQDFGPHPLFYFYIDSNPRWNVHASSPNCHY